MSAAAAADSASPAEPEPVNESESAAFQQTFRLPPTEPLIDSFNCALKKGAILYQGKLYFSPSWATFKSSFLELGHVMIEAESIGQVELSKLLYFIPNSIRITMKDGKSYFFTSFIHRQNAFDLFCSLKDGRLKSAAAAKVKEIENLPQITSNDSESSISPVVSADSAESAVLSKKDRLLAANARRIKEEKIREEKVVFEAMKFERAQAEAAAAAEAESSELNSSSDEELATRKPAEENLADEIESMKLTEKKSEEASKSTKPKKQNKTENETKSQKPPKHRRTATAAETDIPASKSTDPSTPRSSDPRSSSLSPRNRSAAARPSPELPGVRIYDHVLHRLPDERVTKLNEKFQNLENRLDTRNRRYLFEGDLKRQGRWSVVDRRVFLLSDVLLIAKPLDKNGEKYQMKQIIPLDGLIVDIRPLEFHRSEFLNTKLKNPFRLFQLQPTPVSYVLSTDDAEMRQKWISSLALAISRLRWVRNNQSCKTFGWHLKIVWGSIHWAALNDNREIMEFLLKEKPESVNERDQEGSPVLHIAVQSNHSELIEFLIARGADVHLRDAEGKTAIGAAAKLGLANCVQLLLYAEGISVADFHPIGDRQTEKNAKLKKSPDAKKGKLKEISATGFSTGMNLRSESGIWLSALHHSLQFEKCLKLLTQFADRDLKPRRIIDDRDANGVSLIESVVAENLTEVVEVLSGCGANVNSFNANGLTPLGMAAQLGNMEMLIALIQYGAQPNLRPNSSMDSPLHLSSSLEVASYLVANGARTNLKSAEGNRITDLFNSSSQVSTLRAAENLNQNRAPINSSDEIIDSAPTSVSENGDHPLDSCFICQDGFGLNSKRREFCRCCGYLVCSNCALHKLIFLVRPQKNDERKSSGGDDEGIEGRVCDGCFNRCNYRPQTEENRKKRKLRVKEEWGSLQKFEEFITAVRVDANSALAGRGMFQPFGEMEFEEKPEEIIKFSKSKKKKAKQEKQEKDEEETAPQQQKDVATRVSDKKSKRDKIPQIAETETAEVEPEPEPAPVETKKKKKKAKSRENEEENDEKLKEIEEETEEAIGNEKKSAKKTKKKKKEKIED